MPVWSQNGTHSMGSNFRLASVAVLKQRPTVVCALASGHVFGNRTFHGGGKLNWCGGAAARWLAKEHPRVDNSYGGVCL